ncbi:MAG: DUF934 domain-containing protein [Acidocella sp.]|nr:DUF934 domain-containing protein [Acidocella sp.]
MPLINAKGEVIEESGALAERLGPDAKLEDIAPRLNDAALIEIEFPKFRDGRGFTLARTLREHFGYKGDIRAVGHFIPDQFVALAACGFTSFVTPEEHSPAQFAAALSATPEAKQPGQLLRRMVSRAREA